MTGGTHNVDTSSQKNSGTLDIRDEFRLLLLCARTRVGPQQRELIRSFALKQLDWDFSLARARLHALIPLLYRNMSELCPDRVPLLYRITKPTCGSSCLLHCRLS
jgi:hypothetical protein